MSDISQSLGDLIVIQTAPIIEAMESKNPEVAIARAVQMRTMAVMREAVLGDPAAMAAINAARDSFHEWDYLQTLGSAINRDSARERALQALGQSIADLLDIDIDDLLRSRP